MKPKSAIHQYFRKKEVLGKEVYECQYCDLKYSNINATRMKKHIIVCKKCPNEVKICFNPKSTVESEPVAEEVQPENNGSTDGDIDGAIAKAVYVTGSPLSMLEHPLWKDAFLKLNSAYSPPGRKRLSTVLLDSEYKETKDHIVTTINNSQVLHLAVDGWSNIRNEGILNIVIFTPNPYFYSFVETKSNRHTGEYLMTELKKVIEDLGAEKFTAIVTDNASNMKRCGMLLEEEYPHIMWNGCLAHTLHLHVSDILKLKTITNFLSKITKVIKMIKKSQTLTASFQEISNEKKLKVSLQLPVKTRWASYSHCLDNFILSKVVLQNMVVNGNDINLFFSRNHRQLLLDEGFWEKANRLRKFLVPITKWITVLEGNYCSVHKVHSCFLEITENMNTDTAHEILDDDLLETLKKKVEERRETALKPIHFAACILDPSNKGLTLSTTENMDGCELIMKVYEQIDSSPVTEMFQELSEYKNQEGLWSRQFVIDMVDKMSPVAWWKHFYAQTKLGKIASRVLTVPATSAAVERSFSTFANVYTKKRNKLTTERAGKITLISHNWRLLHKSTNNLGLKAASTSASSISSSTEQNDINLECNDSDITDVDTETTESPDSSDTEIDSGSEN